ncbi:hypothetical protein ATO6_14690 [Oceanicola sp. 22II-s10i]|nr:hypothetical protein ATO6_14690 [Oceanicola sp. 22II-s10i]
MNFFYKSAIAMICGLMVTGSPTFSMADSSNRIKFQRTVSLKVGQAMVIHGRRGDCGSFPSKADLAKSKSDLNRVLSTGHIVFGKPGVRKSGSCSGWTPAYETIFVADRPGRETVKIHGDAVRITVR